MNSSTGTMVDPKGPLMSEGVLCRTRNYLVGGEWGPRLGTTRRRTENSSTCRPHEWRAYTYRLVCKNIELVEDKGASFWTSQCLLQIQEIGNKEDVALSALGAFL